MADLLGFSPSPIFRTFYQAGFYGILTYILGVTIKFLFTPAPMIEIFIHPEVALSFQDLICPPGGEALQDSEMLVQPLILTVQVPHEHVNMVGHNGKRVDLPSVIPLQP